MPVTVASIAGCAAAAHAPSSPHMTSGAAEPMSAKVALSSAAFSAVCSTASSGRNSRHCWASSSTFAPAASALTLNRSGYSRTMSSVCVPMLPVLPSRLPPPRGVSPRHP